MITYSYHVWFIRSQWLHLTLIYIPYNCKLSSPRVVCQCELSPYLNEIPPSRNEVCLLALLERSKRLSEPVDRSSIRVDQIGRAHV